MWAKCVFDARWAGPRRGGSSSFFTGSRSAGSRGSRWRAPSRGRGPAPSSPICAATAARVAAYAVPRLVGDIAGLVRALGVPRAHLVGHDWGGVVAWWTAMLRPEVVDRLAIVNAPHPVGYAAAMRTAKQLRRGWYVFFFQLPWVPEWALALRDYGAIRAVFERDGIAPAKALPCVASIRQPGARSAAINYYRASLRAALSGTAPRPRKIETPTLVLWGEKDRFLVPALAQPPGDWVTDARVVRLPDATHWAQIDAADQVASELSAFFRQ